MEVRVSYSNAQIEAAIKFIALNNEVVKDRADYIREQIMSLMEESAGKFPRCPIMGTLGFTIVARDITRENMTHDENYVFFDVLVDPSLGNDDWQDESDYHSHVRNVIK
jgi:hypothetical protein